ncbi:hypothetical protein [Streptomyces sp. NPDC003395]
MNQPNTDDHAALRDRIAQALISWTYRGKEPDPENGILETVRANAYSRADAVLAVLPPVDQSTNACFCRYNPTLTAEIGYPVRCPHCPPGAGGIPPTHWTKHVQRHHPEARPAVLPPVDRAAVLREAADFAETTAEELRKHHEFERSTGALDVMTELRRLADEAQPATEAPKLPPMDPAHILGIEVGVAQPVPRCTYCTHPKSDHDGRADHRQKHSPLVAGEPWCHACNAACDYDEAQPSARP